MIYILFYSIGKKSAQDKKVLSEENVKVSNVVQFNIIMFVKCACTYVYISP